MTFADLVVRPGCDQDLPALTRIYNHFVEHTHVTFDLEPFTVEQRREWYAHYGPTGRHRLMVAGDVVGYATSSRFRHKPAYDPSVESTVYCDPASVGHGAGSALYAALFDALADEDVHRCFAGIALPNAASLALHARFGFTQVGIFTEVGRKFDRWCDVAWLERPL